MAMRLLLVLSIALLLAGCTGTPPAAPSAQSPPANATVSCYDYCPTLQHIQCVGAWNISGTYPGCVCDFVCEQVAQPNTTAQNVSNVSAPPAPPAPLPQPPMQNRSVSDLMAEGIVKIRSRFYSGRSGTFQENTYSWSAEPSGGPGELMGVPAEVEFDGNAVPSIRASAFLVFTDVPSGTREAEGLAIFQAENTPLDSAGTFSVRYLSPVIRKELEDCSSYSIDYNSDLEGRPLVTYFFICERVIDS